MGGPGNDVVYCNKAVSIYQTDSVYHALSQCMIDLIFLISTIFCCSFADLVLVTKSFA